MKSVAISKKIRQLVGYVLLIHIKKPAKNNLAGFFDSKQLSVLATN